MLKKIASSLSVVFGLSALFLVVAVAVYSPIHGVVIANEATSEVEISALIFNRGSGKAETVTSKRVRKNKLKVGDVLGVEIEGGDASLKIEYRLRGKRLDVDCGYTTSGALHLAIIKGEDGQSYCKESSLL